MNSVSVVIPVFNEEKTVANVIKAVSSSGLALEIICVNDGSTDKSLEALKSFGDKIELIDLGKNYGKGFALVAGVKAAKGEIIVFLDSDHPNLSKDHVKDLIEPVLIHGSKAAIGFALSDFTTRFYRLLLGVLVNFNVYTGGQRTYFKKTILPYLDQISKTGYGVDLFLNSLVSTKETKFVSLNGLKTITKGKKWKGIVAFKKWIVFNIELPEQALKNLFKKVK